MAKADIKALKMTQETIHSTRPSARHVAETFFSRYNDQDVPSMVELFQPKGTVEYMPFKLSGPVEEIGPDSWGVLINSFPDLRNEVLSIRQTEDGRTAFVDVNILGKQEHEAFGVPSLGKYYNLRHLFIIETNEHGLITHVTAFWDNADWYVQLGKTTLA